MAKELNIMVDLETLSTKPNARILSIAAVPFACGSEAETPASFYSTVKIELADKRFTSDESTVTWWQQQAQDVREEAFSGTENIANVLAHLRNTMQAWRALTGTTSYIMWGYGADFDLVVLKVAFDATGIPCPWHYRGIRCFRTLRALFSQVPQPAERDDTRKHNALYDAQLQAAHAEKILEMIRSTYRG